MKSAGLHRLTPLGMHLFRKIKLHEEIIENIKEKGDNTSTDALKQKEILERHVAGRRRHLAEEGLML